MEVPHDHSFCQRVTVTSFVTVLETANVLEWYFLLIHAILLSIPDKEGGVAAIAPVFICLLALPFLKSMYVRSSRFRSVF